MKQIWLISVIFLTINIFNNVHSAKILGFFSTSSISHMIVHNSLMHELANRGHEVILLNKINVVIY